MKCRIGDCFLGGVLTSSGQILALVSLPLQFLTSTSNPSKQSQPLVVGSANVPLTLQVSRTCFSQACISQACISQAYNLKGMFCGLHFTGVHLTGVHLTGVSTSISHSHVSLTGIKVLSTTICTESSSPLQRCRAN